MIKNFLKCGLFGWCIEVIWTAICNLKNGNRALIGQTSIWMFPIYGLGAIIRPLNKMCGKHCMVFRGVIYMIGIYIVEYISGSILKKKKCCPWNYSQCKYNVEGLIRLDFAPLWFATGIMMEKIVNKKNP